MMLYLEKPLEWHSSSDNKKNEEKEKDSELVLVLVPQGHLPAFRLWSQRFAMYVRRNLSMASKYPCSTIVSLCVPFGNSFHTLSLVLHC